MTQVEDLSLRIEKHIKAPVARVRAALTDPTLLAKWFAPGPMTATVHACDARVGGQWEIAMIVSGPDGEVERHTATGIFEEMTPTRVASTFNWTEFPIPNETRIVYELTAVSDGTALTMIHTGLPTQESVDQHTEGWNGCLAKLPAACA